MLRWCCAICEGRLTTRPPASCAVQSGPSEAGWPADATCSSGGSHGVGCAPSAAFFGPGWTCRRISSPRPCPQRLVAVDGRSGLRNRLVPHHPGRRGAASVLALTQGVVTSMKFAQLKWIGLALLATGLSAGGAVVVAAVSSQSSGNVGHRKSRPLSSCGSPPQEAAGPRHERQYEHLGIRPQDLGITRETTRRATRALSNSRSIGSIA